MNFCLKLVLIFLLIVCLEYWPGIMDRSSSKRRRGPGSSSPSEPTYDATRFSSSECQNWFQLRKNKSFIIEKDIAPNMEAYFHISETLDRLGWSPIVRLPRIFYPQLVKEFYANVENKDAYSNVLLNTTVRGVKIRLTRRVLSEILGVPDDEELVQLNRRFFWDGDWTVGATTDRFGVRYISSRSEGRQIYKANHSPHSNTS